MPAALWLELCVLSADLIATGEYQICISEAPIEEYKGVSQREKFQKYPGFLEKAASLISSIKKIGVIVSPTKKIEVIEDDPDNRLLEIAVEANACCIITGNTKDFNFEEYEGIKILTPKEFYQLAI
ncbi:MAG: putative toxin-antitoxin system toxin component, PIN family [Candidatus Brocadia sp. WS118]|nr:MAG: putative toxin-antitoxin system toxin component, PIN family [Candidatus Brocadia sp. WS118]